MRRARRKRHALSLIELTIVILVLGLVSAIAAPRLGDCVRGSRLRAAAIQMAGHIDYIRRVAINEGRSTTFSVLASGNGYWSNDVDFPERIGTRLHMNVIQTFDSTIRVSADFDSQTTLTFDFEGTPRVAGAVMQNGRASIGYGDQYYDIFISPGSGTTTLSKRSIVVEGTAGTSS